MANSAVPLEYPQTELKGSEIYTVREGPLDYRLYTYLISGLLLVLPLFFGGINVTANYLAYSLVFLMTGALIIKGGYRKSDFLMKIFGLLSLYIVFQYLYLTFSAVPHPVFTGNAYLIDKELFYGAATSMLFVFAIYFISSHFLDSAEKCFTYIINTICISAFLICLVGLSHWFYDNGKLFWFFEPKSLLISERARWPFVNSNHLGNFLIFGLFLQLSVLLDNLNKLKTLKSSFFDKNGKFLSSKLTGSKFQKMLIGLVFRGIMLLSIGICLTATLSRGSWTGFGVGIVAYLSFSFLISYLGKEGSFNLQRKKVIERVIVKKKKAFSLGIRKVLYKIYKPALVFFGAYLFLFFLNEQGQELVKGRIEYGLKYSLEDMRWTMYEDTLQMIKDKPLLGAGLGQWQKVYPQYMDESIAGINPVYLHSEPLQGLSELGILGSLIILSGAGFLAFKTYKGFRARSLNDNRMLLGVFCGLIAFITATLVEFPLRMPAIQVLFAVSLALLVFEIKRSRLLP